MMKGTRLLNASRLSSGKFNFEFENDNGECTQLSVDFLNSECSRFDGAMKKLKNILYNS
tara:strand:+ start:128 stop:304 length:177 start_codon:yes stop_codon:yes gene_type:complete